MLQSEPVVAEHLFFKNNTNKEGQKIPSERRFKALLIDPFQRKSKKLCFIKMGPLKIKPN
jgi:hypothetical protein